MTRDEALTALMVMAMDPATPVGSKLFLLQQGDKFNFCCGRNEVKAFENAGWNVLPHETVEVLG